MSESIYDIARDFIKFDGKTLDNLAHLMAREGGLRRWPAPDHVLGVG